MSYLHREEVIEAIIDSICEYSNDVLVILYNDIVYDNAHKEIEYNGNDEFEVVA